MLLMLSCSSENGQDPKVDSKGLGEALISEAVVKALTDTANIYLDGECFCQGHIILGTEDDGESTKVYILSMVGHYAFVNSNFEKVSGSGVIPAVVTMKHDNESSIQYPQDGSYYAKSIKEMFPEEYHERIFKDGEKDRFILQEEERTCARNYLEEIGRTAEVGDYRDFEHVLLPNIGVSVEVSNGLESFYKFHSSYPWFLGNQERIEDGVRMVYELSHEEGQEEIIFSKYNYDSQEVMEQFVFDAKTGKQLSP